MTFLHLKVCGSVECKDTSPLRTVTVLVLAEKLAEPCCSYSACSISPFPRDKYKMCSFVLFSFTTSSVLAAVLLLIETIQCIVLQDHIHVKLYFSLRLVSDMFHHFGIFSRRGQSLQCWLKTHVYISVCSSLTLSPCVSLSAYFVGP